MSEKLSYEKAVERLREIVSKLESGEESLESSMKLFEEGAKLSSFCYDALETAQQRVIELTAEESDEQGN